MIVKLIMLPLGAVPEAAHRVRSGLLLTDCLARMSCGVLAQIYPSLPTVAVLQAIASEGESS